MKRAVSISIGSTTRDKKVTFDLLGQTISLERIGTDGDMHKAAGSLSAIGWSGWSTWG